MKEPLLGAEVAVRAIVDEVCHRSEDPQLPLNPTNG